MESEKKEIMKHIFHLKENLQHKYEGPNALMLDFQETFDMIKKYKDAHGDAIGEMDLLMKLFPAILRPNLDRLTEEPAEKIHKLLSYVLRHLETVGKLLTSLYKDVQAEYQVSVREIGDLVKTLDPKRSVLHETKVDISIFLNT